MPYTLKSGRKKRATSFKKLYAPVPNALVDIPQLKARGNRPLQMDFEDHLKALIFFHLEEHTSAQHLLQVLEEDDFAKSEIAPEGGIKKSSFCEATNSRGLEQFLRVFRAS